jgi:hypothetical protein
MLLQAEGELDARALEALELLQAAGYRLSQYRQVGSWWATTVCCQQSEV